MGWQVSVYRLTGDAPLVMHSSALVNPRGKLTKALKDVSGKRKKTDADHERMAEIEFFASLYMDDNGPCLPGENIEAAIYEAARKTKEGKIAKSALFVPDRASLQYDGPRDEAGLLADDSHVLCVPVKVGQARVMRTRPIFSKWSADVEVRWESDIVNQSQVDGWVQTAGLQVGIGDWRPRYGRFQAKLLKK